MTSTRFRTCVRTRICAAALALAALLASSPARAQEAAAKSGLLEPRDAAVRARERDALIAFYNAMRGPDWIQRDRWSSDRPVGEWHGVTTDADGYVVTLMIYDNNVTRPLVIGGLPAATAADVASLVQ